LAAALILPATAALAAPGVGTEVYGTSVDKGEFELENHYDRLVGGPDDGEWKWVGEAAYSFTDRFHATAMVEVEREPGFDAEALSLEAIYEVGRLPGDIGFAVYGEYESTLHGQPDEIELKALFEKEVGRFDARLNLIAAKPLDDHADWEFGYAALADWEVAEDVRFGVMAFGDAGDEHGFGGWREHFVGPAAEVEFDELPIAGELEIKVGYLFALGAARDDADGQARLALEYKRAF
jgi:hypothetical protein